MTVLGWPGSTLTITTLNSSRINLASLTSVQLLNSTAGSYTNTDYLAADLVGTGTLGLTGEILKGTKIRNYKGVGFFKLSGGTLFCGNTPLTAGSCDPLPASPLTLTELGKQTVMAEVDYNYTPVPEPATMGLIGTSLLGAALLRKRFSRVG